MSTATRYMLVICTFDPAQLEAFTHYATHARPIFGANGGRPVGQYAAESTVVGDTPVTHVIVMEFPSADAIGAVFADPAYQALVPARTAAFPNLQILIMADFDPRSLSIPSA